MDTLYYRIEKMIDTYSLVEVLLIIGDIAENKAGYNDKYSDKWDRVEPIIKQVIRKLPRGL